MTTNRFLLMACLLITATGLSLSAQEKKKLKAKVSEATVFFRGAELNHSLTAPLVKGENEIVVEGLSPSIDLNSLKIKTAQGVVVSTYEFSTDYLSDDRPSEPMLQRLRDSVDHYARHFERTKTEIMITDNLLNLLQEGTDKNVAGSEKGLGIDELVKTMDYYKQKSAELYAEHSILTRRRQEMEAALVKFSNQLNQETVKNNKTSGVLKLTLSSPVAASIPFLISYYTPMASWTPYYDVNVESTDRPVRLTLRSKVRQTTGLDWEKIRITLSTSAPGDGKTAPLFTAWFLDFQRPAPIVTGYGRMKEAVQNTYSYEVAEVVMAPSEEMMDMKQELSPATVDDYVQQSDNELNIQYAIDLPYTIPGNGKEQNIDLQTKEATAEYKYYCAPKLDTETYLLAEIEGWEQLNLLSGKANVTYDGTYVGETYIDARSTHAKLSLTLGADKRVSVRREKMHDYSSRRFLGNDIRQTFTYKLTVRNNQTRPVKLVLKDQYPLSTQKTIEVELLKETTPWTANVEGLGVITWEEDLPAGSTREYRLSYSVKYPKDSNINL